MALQSINRWSIKNQRRLLHILDAFIDVSQCKKKWKSEKSKNFWLVVYTHKTARWKPHLNSPKTKPLVLIAHKISSKKEPVTFLLNRDRVTYSTACKSDMRPLLRQPGRTTPPPLLHIHTDTGDEWRHLRNVFHHLGWEKNDTSMYPTSQFLQELSQNVILNIFLLK